MRVRQLIIGLILGVLVGVTFGTAYGAEQVDALMEDGRRLLQQGDLNAALQEFEKVLRIEGSNAEALYRVATIYLRLKQFSKGIEYLERSVKAAPDNVRLHMVLAQAYENEQMFDKAVAEYRKVQEINSGSVDAREANKRERVLTAKQFGREGKLERALEEFNSVLKDYPDDVPIMIDEGLTLMFMGRLEEARMVMEGALRLQPDNGLIHRYLGDIAEKKGRLEESAQHYQQALRLAPAGSPVIQIVENKLALVRGSQFLTDGKLADARREYEKVLKSEPENPVARFNLAKIYHDLGDLPRAEEMLKSLYDANPDDLGIELRLGTLYLEQGNLEEASRRFNDVVAKGGDTPEAKQAKELLSGIRSTAGSSSQAMPDDERLALYRSMVDTNPDDRRAWLDLGLLYAKLGRREEAADAFEHVVQLGPGDARAQAVLGGLYDDMGKLDQALAALNRALDLENNPTQKARIAEQIAMVIAKRAYNTGDLDVAQREFSEIAEVNRDNYVAHFFLALIYARNGDNDKAEAEYKEVLRLVPGHALARLSLAAIHEQTGREEEAASDYRAVMISRVPGLSDTARDRLAALTKKIGGLTFNAGYSFSFDSNSNLSPTTPSEELRSDATGAVSYQRKVKGKRLFWGIRFNPTYSIYHQQQFDFLSMEVSPFINGVWRGLNWSANYAFDQTDGVLVEQHYNRSNTLYADVLQRFKMPSLLPFVVDEQSDGMVASAWRINGSYRTFRSVSSPIYDANVYNMGALLSQSGASGWSWTGIYNYSSNENVLTIGNDFAYSSHGINLQLSKGITPRLAVNGGYGFTYSRYAHPDSVTRFTRFRINKLHALSLGVNYTVNDRLRFYGNFVYQRNNSNLPTGFILSTEDVGTAVGIQSPSLGTYHKYGITMGMGLNF